MKRMAISNSILAAGVLAVGMVSSPAFAQAFSAGADKVVPRFCTNACVQINEQIAVDGSGNAVAMWNEPFYQESESYTALVGARYTASSNSWSAAKKLTHLYGDLPMGKLEMDAAGNATMVFADNLPNYSYTDHNMYAAKWVAGYGWRVDIAKTEYGWKFREKKAASVGRNGHIFVNYAVDEDIINREGREMAAGSRTLIYSPSTKTWSTVMGRAGDELDAVVADPYGGAIGFHLGSQLWTMRFDTATRAWVTIPGALENAGNFKISQFQAVSDRAGNIMVLYEKHDYATSTRQLKSARYQPSTRTWSRKTVPVIASSRLYGAPSLAADRFNNFYATWVQYSGAYTKTISARYSNSGAVWSKPVVISRGNYHTRDSAVVTDYAGNAIYTWGQRTDTGTGSSTGKIFRTTAVRYSNWTWGTPMIIQDANRIGYKPFIGADNSGRAIVMWTQDSSIAGIKEIRSDRLTPR